MKKSDRVFYESVHDCVFGKNASVFANVQKMGLSVFMNKHVTEACIVVNDSFLLLDRGSFQGYFCFSIPRSAMKFVPEQFQQFESLEEFSKRVKGLKSFIGRQIVQDVVFVNRGNDRTRLKFLDKEGHEHVVLDVGSLEELKLKVDLDI